MKMLFVLFNIFLLISISECYQFLNVRSNSGKYIGKKFWFSDELKSDVANELSNEKDLRSNLIFSNDSDISNLVKNFTTFKIYVGNFSFDDQEDSIKNFLMNKFENDDYKINLSKHKDSGNFKGYGIMEFPSIELAKKAFDTLSGCEFNGRILKIDFYKPFLNRFESSNNNSSSSKNYGDIYLGNLDVSVNESDVLEFLKEQIGPDSILRVKFPQAFENGEPRGFCHVYLNNSNTIKDVIFKLQDKFLKGRQVRVQPALSKNDERIPRFTVFVGNLPFSMTHETIEEFIRTAISPHAYSNIRHSFGENQNLNRGFCHIDFSTEEQANSSVEKLVGIELNGRRISASRAKSFFKIPKFKKRNKDSEIENIENIALKNTQEEPSLLELN